MVRADRATRRRAPGGSFIWPKTMTVFDDVLAGSWRRSGLPAFPARGRCLRGCVRRRRRTPSSRRAAGDAGDEFLNDDGLAEAGPAEQAGLAAADERREQVDDLDAGFEDFGLRARGRRTSAARGGSGRVSVAATGPRLSIGSPSRLNTRPRVSLPTGTVTGAPVSTTSMPRTRPSVEPSATQRTRLPPRCCCTSPTRWSLTPFVLRIDCARRCRFRADDLRETRRQMSSR